MRPLLLALLLLWLPAAAPAQPQSTLQQMSVWAQQLSAAQQPIIDTYHQCSPVLQQIETALQARAREALREFATDTTYRNCLESMRRAAQTTRDNLTRMGPMPLEMERELHLDSRDILRRSAASIDGMVGYNEKIQEALDAFAAGNMELVLRRLHESRALAGSVIDGQILLLETMRAALPLQAHKSMMDVRLVITRSLRILSVADPATDAGEASASLRAEGARARIVAHELRANWSRETAAMHRAVARLGDSRRAALVAAVDGAIEEIAVVSERIATSLEALPSGTLDGSRALGIMRELAEAELLVLERARVIAVAAGQLG